MPRTAEARPLPATLSYEAQFTPNQDLVHKQDQIINLHFHDFKPTYRGKQVSRSDQRYQPLKSEHIYEMSLMCRSGFGAQQGDFDLVITEIDGWDKQDKKSLWTVLVGKMWGMVNWVMELFGRNRSRPDDEEKQPLV